MFAFLDACLCRAGAGWREDRGAGHGRGGGEYEEACRGDDEGGERGMDKVADAEGVESI